jgi:uncharacterized membrane protein
MYLHSRKNWFYGILACTFVAVVVNTLIKRKLIFLHFGWENTVRNALRCILCLVAIGINNKKYHAFLAIIFILYELSYILRLFLPNKPPETDVNINLTLTVEALNLQELPWCCVH